MAAMNVAETGDGENPGDDDSLAPDPADKAAGRLGGPHAG